MTRTSHLVLGGNGIAGRETVRALIERGLTPTSVGRRSARTEGARSATADLLDAADLHRLLPGAEVAYLTAGLPYSSRVWAAQWPTIVRNTVDAALANDVHLVYLDNVYAYGRVDAPMTERTPLAPVSRKGRIRAEALRHLEEAARRGLSVTIARSADFYGPGATTSVFNSFAVDRVARGRRATWLFDADQPHSLTYTPDLGDALALIGTTESARGRTWHLPTAPAQTGRDYLGILGSDGVSVMSAATMRVGALFNRSAKETLEMAYQYTAPYDFDSTAFASAFGAEATPARVGIARTLAAAKSPLQPAGAARR